MIKRSAEEISEREKKFFESLSEKDKRRFSAIEAMKIGKYGVTEISKKFGITEKTIREGIKELDTEDISENRIRKEGGGRKKN